MVKKNKDIAFSFKACLTARAKEQGEDVQSVLAPMVSKDSFVVLVFQRIRDVLA